MNTQAEQGDEDFDFQVGWSPSLQSPHWMSAAAVRPPIAGTPLSQSPPNPSRPTVATKASFSLDEHRPAPPSQPSRRSPWNSEFSRCGCCGAKVRSEGRRSPRYRKTDRRR
ncbi:unnamed protein product [Linum trigynum]|uniref:Uncharacterized protein n=1 Tax=Linum trigynum TaxID=586398 RepID=A0AAV2F7J8_9ROSI